FFFFQAEDGIRDDLVTGVQTCALPISCRDDTLMIDPWPAARMYGIVARQSHIGAVRLTRSAASQYPSSMSAIELSFPTVLATARSEERRVGNAWRARERAGQGTEKGSS